MGKTIGIDLGTTNSCVAVLEGGQATIVINADGNRTTPSVVAFAKDGQRLVGAIAKRQAAVNPDRTISSVKREMGSAWSKRIDGHDYTAPEISAMILRKLKKDVETFLGETVTDAVITVPAYFNDSQRQATKDAGTIAGLNVQRIINEPTSAALAYGVDKEENKKVMVFDLGGGTFDVSILNISDGIIEVLATAGNNRLGGDDFDECIVDWLLDTFQAQHRIDLSKDAAAMQRIREAAEAAKIDLSSTSSTTINLPFITADKNGPIHIEQRLTRAEFDRMTAHLVEATLRPMKQAMDDAGITMADLGKTLLVGGSTRIPAVREAVVHFTGKEPYQGINPDECVAMGACLQGGVLAGKVNGLLLLDVTPLSLGVETLGDVTTCMIPRNSTIPITKSELFSTSANFQTEVEINVLQGESQKASQNKSLGKFRLNGIRRAPRGVPRIEVTFSLDANGIVHVSARDLDTGKAQQVTIAGSSNLNQKQIGAARQDILDYERKLLDK